MLCGRDDTIYTNQQNFKDLRYVSIMQKYFIDVKRL